MDSPSVNVPQLFSSAAETPLSRLKTDRDDFIAKIRKRFADMGVDASKLTDDQLLEGASRRLPEVSRYLAAPAPEPKPKPLSDQQFVSQMNRFGTSLSAGAVRSATGLIGNTPLVGGLVAGGGELGAQLLEARGHVRDDLNWDRVLLEAGIGAIPGGKLKSSGSALSRIVKSGARGSAEAAFGDFLTQAADEGAIDYERLLGSASTGAVVGGALGGAFGRTPSKPAEVPAPPAPRSAAEVIRELDAQQPKWSLDARAAIEREPLLAIRQANEATVARLQDTARSRENAQLAERLFAKDAAREAAEVRKQGEQVAREQRRAQQLAERQAAQDAKAAQTAEAQARKDRGRREEREAAAIRRDTLAADNARLREMQLAEAAQQRERATQAKAEALQRKEQRRAEQLAERQAAKDAKASRVAPAAPKVDNTTAVRAEARGAPLSTRPAAVENPSPSAPPSTPTTRRPETPSRVTRYIALDPEDAATAQEMGIPRVSFATALRPSDLDQPGKIILAIDSPADKALGEIATGPIDSKRIRQLGSAADQEALLRMDLAEEGALGASNLLGEDELRRVMREGRIYDPDASAAATAMRAERATLDAPASVRLPSDRPRLSKAQRAEQARVRAAADAILAEGAQRQAGRLPSNSGAVSSDIAFALGGGFAGGLTGAAASDDPLMGGVAGALAGATLGSAAGKRSTLPQLDPAKLRAFAETIPRESPASFDRNLGRVVQAGLMLSPKVHTANAISNTANAAFGNFAQPFKAAVSAFQGDMAPLRGLPAFYGAIPQGIRNGVDDAAFAWRAGFGKDVGQDLQKLEASGLTGDELAAAVRKLANPDLANVGGGWRNPIGRVYESGSRAAGAADAFFSGVAREQNRAGLIAGGVDEATAGAVAARRALESTFQESVREGGLRQRLMNLRGDGAGKVFVPFMRTVGNAANQGIGATPLAGFLPEVREALRKGGTERANVLGNALAGTTLMLGAHTAGTQLTGGYPASQRERQELAASERSPNSFGLEHGDGSTTWIPNNLLGRMSMPLSLMGAVQDSVRTGKLDAFDLAARGASTAVDAHPLGSASQNLEALAGGDATALRNFARRTAENLVPGIGLLRAASDVIDPTVRDAWRTTGPAPSLYPIANALGIDTPFAPPKLDLTGHAKRKHGLGEGLLGDAAVGFMPRVTTTPTGRLDEIDAFHDERLSIAPPSLGVLQRQYPDAPLPALSRIQAAMQQGVYQAVQEGKNARKARRREEKHAARDEGVKKAKRP